MRCRSRCLGTLAATGLVLGSCASLDPEPEWKSVQSLVQDGAGETPAWTRTPADAEAARSLVASLLEDGLTRREAVQIALVNDPRLQAQFDALGQAKADQVQAGLFTNPSLGAFVGFPLRFDGSAVTLLTFLSDLWVVPARQAVADVALQGVVQRAGSAALETIFETEQAYDTVLYQEALLGLEQKELALRRSSAERLRHASKRELEKAKRENAATAGIGDQEIAFAQAVRDLALARHHLEQILDLPGRHLDVPLSDPLDEPTEDAWSEDRAVGFALERRLDIAAAQLQIELATRRAALARRARFSQLAAGPGYNGAFGHQDNWGPSVAVDVPIFDRKQADLANAAFEELQSEHELEALRALAQREVADAMAERQLQRSQAEILRFEVLPARERLLQSSGPDGPSDFAEYLHWLQVKADAIEARRSYVNAVWSLRLAQSDFQRALYGGSADRR